MTMANVSMPADEPVRRNASAVTAHRWLYALMEAEGPAVLRMLWRILGNEADVLDAYQDCFCKLAGMDKKPKIRQARAYLFRTAANIAIEFIRVRKRQKKHAGAILDVHADRNGESLMPQEALERERAIASLHEAIDQLPAHLRNVLLVRDFSGKSYKEVAEILGIDKATARVYRRTAIVKLANLLQEGSAS